MRGTLARLVVLALGFGFIGLGTLSLFVPVLPGVLFLFIGLALILGQSRWSRRLFVRARRRWPTPFHPFESWRRRRRERRQGKRGGGT